MISAYVTQPSQASANLKSRSMGNKFFLVLLLAVLMSIPGFFMSSLTSDRAAAKGLADVYNSAGTTAHQPSVLGIRLADSYRSVNRSLKYITLFLGLVFLTYFIFEVTTGTRVHPAQYALVGVAQTIFYLLLLSLAEHVGFDVAFLVAGASTVLLFRSTQSGSLPAASRPTEHLQCFPCCMPSSTCFFGSKTMPCLWVRAPALQPWRQPCISRATSTGTAQAGNLPRQVRQWVALQPSLVTRFLIETARARVARSRAWKSAASSPSNSARAHHLYRVHDDLVKVVDEPKHSFTEGEIQLRNLRRRRR